jgi:hypothetical protein
MRISSHWAPRRSATGFDATFIRAGSMRVAIVIVAALSGAVVAQQPLTDKQVAAAIVLGKAGTGPAVRVGASRDFEVFIRGPVGRIAAIAADAAKRFRPFEAADVTAEMRAPTYVVTVLSTFTSQYLAPARIVLQPKGAKGVEGVIQPTSVGQTFDRMLLGRDATFARLPEGDFDVVVVTPDGVSQRFAVPARLRAQVR